MAQQMECGEYGEYGEEELSTPGEKSAAPGSGGSGGSGGNYKTCKFCRGKLLIPAYKLVDEDPGCAHDFEAEPPHQLESQMYDQLEFVRNLSQRFVAKYDTDRNSWVGLL